MSLAAVDDESYALCCEALAGYEKAAVKSETSLGMLNIGQAVINLGGTVDYFVENTFNYPTLAEAYKIAGLDAWNRMGAP